MRTPRLSPRDRRALLLGLVILGPALFWAYAVRPYLDAVGEARARLEADRALLSRELALVAGAGAHPAAFRVGAERLLAAAPRLFGGTDDGAASAAVARYLRNAAGLGSAHVTRVEPGPSRPAGRGVTALSVELAGESDLEGLLSLLRLLETGSKLVHVESVRLEGNAAGRPAAGASYALTPFMPASGPDAASPEVIVFRLVATGFTLAPSDSARAPAAETPRPIADR